MDLPLLERSQFAHILASAGHDCLIIALNHDRESTVLSGEVTLFRTRCTFAG
jgi:hypothetical protein